MTVLADLILQYFLDQIRMIIVAGFSFLFFFFEIYEGHLLDRK